MRVTIKNGKMNRDELELEIAKLKSIVGDLERILHGDFPEDYKLADEHSRIDLSGRRTN